MKFDPKIKQKEFNKLSDILDNEVLHLIQLGFSREYYSPLIIIEKNNENFTFPIGTMNASYSKFCWTIQNSNKGKVFCQRCLTEQAKKVYENNIVSAEYFKCRTGLLNISVPIIIGGRIVAIIISGQKRCSELGFDFDKDFVENALFSRKHDIDKYTNLINQIEDYSEDDLSSYKEIVMRVTNQISSLAESVYETNRKLTEELFFEESISFFVNECRKEKNSLPNVLKSIINEAFKFCHIDEYFLYFSKDINPFFIASDKTEEFSSKLIIQEVNNYVFAEKNLRNSERIILSKLSRAKEKLLFQHETGKRKNKFTIILYLDDNAYILILFSLNNYRGINIQEVNNQSIRFINRFCAVFYDQFNSTVLREHENTFLASLAHELKSPPHNVLGICYSIKQLLISFFHNIQMNHFPDQDQKDPLLNEYYQTENKIQKELNSIESQMNKLRFKIDALLFQFESESTGLVFDFRLKNIPSILNKVIAANKPRAERFNKNIICKYQADSFEEIKVDGDKLETVFDILIDNAIKYSFRNRNIEIQTEIVHDALSKNKQLLISFYDFGIGIHENELDLIFKPFYRSRYFKDPQRSINGSGIGLSVAKSIIEKHNGKIFVESFKDSKQEIGDAVGFHTKFIILLPIDWRNK